MARSRLPKAITVLMLLAMTSFVALGFGWEVRAEPVDGLKGPLDPTVAGSYVPGEILVKFVLVPKQKDLAAVEVAFPMVTGWRALRHAPHYKNRPGVVHPLAYFRVANVDPALNESVLAGKIARTAGVVSAETNGYTRAAFVPNDARYNEQYGPQITRTEEAWDITLGDSDVIVAIADTGVYFEHEDMAGSFWQNDDPVNGIDDDGNGFVDDWRGWDFHNDDNDPKDGHMHGTHVSGTVAARTDNGVGVAGMAQVQIMGLKIWSDQGYGNVVFDAEAIAYATDNGAALLNESGGWMNPAQVLEDAVKYAWDNGMTTVAAMHNHGQNLKIYPAAYPEVIAVAATDKNDGRPSWSNYGDWVDVAAPGVDVISCGIGSPSSYVNGSGTSMSTPHTSGLVALMYSLNPELSPQEVRDLLQENAHDLGAPGFDNYYGWGRIDAAATLQAMGSGECLELALDQLIAGVKSTWTVTGGTEGAKIALLYGFNEVEQRINGVLGFCATFGFSGIGPSRLVDGMKVTTGGEAVFMRFIPAQMRGIEVKFQAAERGTCPEECVSAVLDEVVG